jgi:HlyD family secretion protein
MIAPENISATRCKENVPPTQIASVAPESNHQIATNSTNWSTPVQSILDQPPAKFSHYVLLSGLAFSAIFTTWAIFGQIDEVGKAQGRLIPQGDVYKVHPIELGKVSSIQVKEGDFVTVGQKLVVLDAQLAQDEVDRIKQLLRDLQSQLKAKEALIAKTNLEVETRGAIANADSQMQQAMILQAQSKSIEMAELLNQHQQAIAIDHERIEGIKPLIPVSQALLNQRQSEADALAERLERLKPLVEEGALSKEYVFQAEQNLRASQMAINQGKLQERTTLQEQIFQTQQNLRDRRSTIIRNQSELEQSQAEIIRLQAGSVKKSAEAKTTALETQQKIQQLEIELSQLQAKIAESHIQLASANARLEQKYLYAPVDGVISSLNVRNIGEVLQAGQTVAEIAPKNAPLILLANLPTREAGFVKAGMSVQIKLDAYPYQNYGLVTGKVIEISADAKSDQQSGAFYQVRVSLDRDYVNSNSGKVTFKSGQTANAEIVIRHRRIIDVLLDPIQKMQTGGNSL